MYKTCQHMHTKVRCLKFIDSSVPFGTKLVAMVDDQVVSEFVPTQEMASWEPGKIVDAILEWANKVIEDHANPDHSAL